MRALALPGRKPSTLAPTRALVEALGFEAGIVRPHNFWSAPDVTSPDIVPDVIAVAAGGAELVIAKSIGALIAMAAWRDHGFRPRACLFVGTPLRRLEQLDLIPLLRDFAAATPVLFIQQTSDFNGPFADLAQVVGPPGEIAEVPGADHAYQDIAALAPLARAWLEPWRRDSL